MLLKAHYSEAEISAYLSSQNAVRPAPVSAVAPAETYVAPAPAPVVNRSPVDIPSPIVRSTMTAPPAPAASVDVRKGRFQGRVNRKNYLFGSLVLLLTSSLMLLFPRLFAHNIYVVFFVTIVLVGIVVILGISLTVRRLHDIGHSWLLLLLNLIPYVNIGLFIYLLVRKGSIGPNAYGDLVSPQPFWKTFFAVA